MIFHYNTDTAIILPNKAGSCSLREMLGSLPGFVVCTGPAAWNPRELTYHAPSSAIDRIHGRPIRRRLLLVREPLPRIMSLWQYNRTHEPSLPNFMPWLSFSKEHPAYMPMTQYCARPDGYIRCSHMVEDVERHFGLSPIGRHSNRSEIPKPFIGIEDGKKIRQWYKADFDMWEKVRAQ